MSNDLLKRIKSARRVGVPLVAITTPDSPAFVSRLKDEVNGSLPLVQWDCLRGWLALNESGKSAIVSAIGSLDNAAIATQNPTGSLEQAFNLPEGSILVCHGMNRFLEDAVVIQGIANLRDTYKASERMLILLATELILPPELAQDVLLLDEPFPTREEIADIVRSVIKSAQDNGASSLVVPDSAIIRAADALSGIAAFPAEQSASLSLSKTELDINECWERKRRMIEQTRGLTVDREGITFADLDGLDSAELFARRLMKAGKTRTIVRLDEMDKLFAGTGTQGIGDSSGVSQDMHGVVLKMMDDNEYNGMITVGPPGSGKTAFSRAMGNTFGIPTISADFGAAKSSLVGSSEAMIRTLAKTIYAVAGRGGAFFVGTCNKLEALSPELIRRFTAGTWYFDLLSDKNRAKVWTLNRKKYGIPDTDPGVKQDSNWTGAEIRNCCRFASDLEISLEEASGYIVPVAVSNWESIAKLRKLADGRFLSAADLDKDGKAMFYRIPDSSPMGVRKLTLGE
jgi:ATPase family associated with various cellular activities (AAA)